jgi:hypothetical protein
VLIARKDPRQLPRVVARWLMRYLEESDAATIDEASMVAACLAALCGDRHGTRRWHLGRRPNEWLVDAELVA